ncbi:transporter substrate-binding domain-containing protein [Pseudoduganella eburnea]|uniref:Transporter substrate-binding domain-containing protein n=1 Tax=Massilia eburnea TaxID=1776165 RepID=A0A6L6QEB1_9BURK|nr:transporter substrate-binding domain-containing protein [Massilia eburnea]MTW10491.1 transporter substrate-binding domain-containing protein [Massilia eburnea]
MAKLLRTVLTLLLAWPLWAFSASYPAYNTYLHPPFVLPDGHGLAAELVEALNRHMGPDSFVLENVPRARFLAMANQGQGKIDGIALFLSPTFLREPLASRVGWSAPLFADHNVLVFKAGHVPASQMPASLRGLRFGAVRGNVYRFLDGMGRRGELHYEEVADETTNLRKLIAGRIDFTLLNRLHFHALAENSPELQELVATPEPGGDFLRHILLSPSLPPATAQRLAAAIQALQRDAEWQAVLARYGVAPAKATSG